MKKSISKCISFIITCDKGGQKTPTNLTKLFTPLNSPGKSICDKILVRPVRPPPPPPPPLDGASPPPICLKIFKK